MRIYFLVLIAILLNSCSKYNVETIVQVEYNNASTNEIVNTKSMLEKKLKDVGFLKTKITADPETNQLTILSKIKKDQKEHFELFNTQITNPSIGFWHTFRVGDDYIIDIKSDLPIISSFKPNEFLGRKNLAEYASNKEVIGETKNLDSLEIIKSQLEQYLKGYKKLKLIWSTDQEYYINSTETEQSPFYLYMINTEGKLIAPIHGGHLNKIATEVDPYSGSPIITMELNDEGTEIFSKMTRKAFIEGNGSIAIVINNNVLSAPSVAGEISNGKLSVSGSFSLTEANDLKESIQACMNLPYSMHLISQKIK